MYLPRPPFHDAFTRPSLHCNPAKNKQNKRKERKTKQTNKCERDITEYVFAQDNLFLVSRVFPVSFPVMIKQKDWNSLLDKAKKVYALVYRSCYVQ